MRGCYPFIFLFLFFSGLQLPAQTDSYDLLDQVALVKGLMPQIKRIGVFLGPEDHPHIQKGLERIRIDLGVEVKAIRLTDAGQQMPAILRHNVVQLVETHQVQAVLVYSVRDAFLQEDWPAKAVVSTASKSGIPSFANFKRAGRLGAAGTFEFQGEWWIVALNKKAVKTFGLQLLDPERMSLY
jgi:ABC-type uncharacterized transport system substrate-binding protein